MAKTALVTGANRGLGFEIARQLANADHTVVIGARNPTKGDKAAELLRREGLAVESVTLDVDDPESVAQAARQLRDRHDRLDALVNNAGVLPEATADPHDALSASMFCATFETNLFGAVRTTEQLLPLLRNSCLWSLPVRP